MPRGVKKNAPKVSTVRVLVRDSSAFLVPLASSSPSVNRDESKCTELCNGLPVEGCVQALCEKEIKEERLKKEAWKDEINKHIVLLLMKSDADAVYYSCTDDDRHMNKRNEGTNKRTREEDIMPPPLAIKKNTRKASKKPRNDSEVGTSNRSSNMRTRSSTRVMAQSSNKENLQSNEAHQSGNNFTDFKTPAAKGFFRRDRHNIATVTPGPNIDAPQTILRRPNPGETAISLSGSPLLVSSEQTSFVPQITIPLEDGRVMAVLAKDGLNPSDFPTMDSRTLSRLKLLHEFLGKL
ncbi:hypothetical protein O3M35_003192 [Rhynocoris fuscipes]|uniref:Borealin C-terminal domain-containing protein n=1 Tax=Rhynocoris fuscipes TaxID=488301 RepID=A0AAW1CM82_9HEMI